MEKYKVAVSVSDNELMFVDEIDCSDLFPNSKEINRERIVIFEIIK